MARKVKVSSSQLNIRLHPHSPDIYEAFFRAIFQRRAVAQVHGDRHGMISLLDTSQVKNGYVSGVITTFVRIEIDGSWFNSESLTEATEDQISKVVLPDNLNPNVASFYFDFELKTHRLDIQQYSKGKVLTPASALRLWSGLSRHAVVMQDFGEAKISIVQSKSALSVLFNIPKINRIDIKILRPNPDVFSDDFETEIEKHLNETNSRSIRVEYEAEAGGSIVPDDDIRKISKAALTNGRVDVAGRDDTGAVVRSTADFPQVIQTKYDPDQTSERNAFYSLVRGVGKQD